MIIEPHVDNGALERCVINIDFDPAQTISERCQQLLGIWTVCRAPIFEFGENHVSRIGVQSVFSEEEKRGLIIKVEKVVGPVSGVGEAYTVFARPQDPIEVPNLGLPVYRHGKSDYRSNLKSFFGDREGVVQGLDAVGSIIFDDKMIICGLKERKIYPVEGVNPLEATAFTRICLSGMVKKVKNGEVQRIE